ncbi:beta-glucosidase-like glycosyl hydrolase [Agrilactobacillus composti DSM 18527 = JCM 14202]|uniref:Beta-glucosidase-like glycosyl hydrolase n=1 Tax=Agrilactobacillus composti DSM 18527 = JCM 14202 TaxID=1423734 RepID=A0A0R1XV93_9LACO|nr:glycoside hydrolase family 3 protein [Agrilactobacillus composti]KRM30691.1 beta-glucosidase-like glycosyl hydrolase [Agrilactobacillus composti DSM 18527 = JCM 14202]
MKKIFNILGILGLSALLLVVPSHKVSAAITGPGYTPTEVNNQNLSTKIASNGMVLLQNNAQQNGAASLPISKNSRIALFGSGSYGTYKGGSGSGDVNVSHVTSILEGLKNANYNVVTSSYLSAQQADYNNQAAWYKATAGLIPFSGNFQYQDPLINDLTFLTNSADTGIYVISRSSGEGYDRTTKAGDYQLTSNEMNNIINMSNHYKNSVVLLNVGGPIDTSFVTQAPNLKSVVLVSQGGQNVGTAVANILSGAVNPSGHLTDTWAKSYSDYPTSGTFANNDGNTNNENYAEGIYVGYRYFDSYNIAPRYPFGFGLTYTKFAMDTTSVNVDKDIVSMNVNVTNTGKTAGRQTVQVYLSSPKGAIPTAFQDLAGFAKTGQLAPGASQNVKIEFSLKNLAAYDVASAAYKLQAGDYILRVGDSSRNTAVAGVLNLDKTVITNQLANEGAPTVDPTTLKGSDNMYTPDNQAAQLSTAPQFTVDANSLQDLNNHASTYSGESTPIYVNNDQSAADLRAKAPNQKIEVVDPSNNATLKDVYDKKISMNQFVAGLTTTELARIVEGNVDFATQAGLEAFVNQIGLGVIGGAATKVPGAAGQTTDRLLNKKVPIIVSSDGPAGLRLPKKSTVNGVDYYNNATAWPIGTLVAQTWDVNDIYSMGQGTAKEMKDFGITTWLTPGMNIHRDPLNGRNFEYFSEDPLVSGLMATAETRGVQTTPGIGVAVKHFAANSQESNRMGMNASIGEQALRQIYLRGFEIAIKGSQPQFVMSSYNKVNGQYVSSSYDLLTDVLRGEWGYQGTVMSDWDNIQTMSTPQNSVYAGNDLIMPGGSQILLEPAANNSPQTLAALQNAAKHVLTTIMNSDQFANESNVTVKSYTPSNLSTTLKINGKSW